MSTEKKGETKSIKSFADMRGSKLILRYIVGKPFSVENTATYCRWKEEEESSVLVTVKQSRGHFDVSSRSILSMGLWCMKSWDRS